MKTIFSAALAIAMGIAAAPAFAQSAGDFTLGFGFHTVNPKSNNGTVAGARSDISNSVRPTFTFEYFVKDNLGVEVLAALPFKHTVSLAGLGDVATVKQLPPVVSIQYHFANETKFTPFLGAGVNYTKFFSQDTEGAIAGNKIDVDDSWGIALHAGVDYAITEHGSLRADVRWIDISSDVKLNGSKIGTVDVNPWVFGMAYVYRF